MIQNACILLSNSTIVYDGTSFNTLPAKRVCNAEAGSFMVMRKAAARKKRARQEMQQAEPPEEELGPANEEEDPENRPSDEQPEPADDEAQIPATNPKEAEENRQASPQHSKQEVRNTSGNEGGDVEAASARGSPRDPFDELEEEEVRSHRAAHHLSTLQVY